MGEFYAMHFSVIIPVYNLAPYLRTCLDSVLAAANYYGSSTPPTSNLQPQAPSPKPQTSNPQTSSIKRQTSNINPLVEIICVDDGSTDGSAAILDDYASNPPTLQPSNPPTLQTSILVLHQPNRGVSAARNAALDVATGDYVCFVDGDDGVCENYFVVLKEQLENSAVELLKFRARSAEDVSPGVRISDAASVQAYDLSSHESARTAYRVVTGGLIAWNACYKRSLIGDLRFDLDLPNGEDILFGVTSFCRAKRVGVMSAVIYQYRCRAGSAVRTISLRHLRSVCQMAMRQRQGEVGAWIARNGLEDLFARRLRVHLVGEVLGRIGCVSPNERSAVWGNFWEALAVCAWSPLVKGIARMRSQLLARAFLLTDIRLRTCVSKWLRRHKGHMRG